MQISFVGFQVGSRMICRLEDGHFVGCSGTTASWYLVSLLAFTIDIVSGCWLLGLAPVTLIRCDLWQDELLEVLDDFQSC